MRIIALSDTHGFTNVAVPDGDVLIFAGDSTKYGRPTEDISFANWMSEFPHEHKIYVAGNHDLGMYLDMTKGIKTTHAFMKEHGITYLQDEALVIDGVRFYGTPWMTMYNNWAFMLDPGEELNRYRQMIPTDTNVLVTHCPPYGILDYGLSNTHFGCKALRERLDDMADSLQAHIFGHIHEQHGTKLDLFHNVSICNRSYEPVNPSTIVDI